MRSEFIDVNANNLHEELIKNYIKPIHVESLGNKTWITFTKDTDLELVQRIVALHDSTLVPEPKSEIDKLKEENNVLKVAIDVILTKLIPSFFEKN